MLTFDYPQTYAISGTAEEQIAQLRAYIWKLVDALNQAMDGDGQETAHGGDSCAALKKKLDKKGGTVDGSLDVSGSVFAQGALQSGTMLSAPSLTVHNDAQDAAVTLSCVGVRAAKLTCISEGTYQNARLAVGDPTEESDAATKKYVDDASAAADRVIEQGKTGYWTWRKWASGIAEMWIVFGTDKLQISTAWGSMYFGTWMDSAQNVEARKYPFAFAEPPSVTVTYSSGGGDAWPTSAFNGSDDPLASAPAYALARPNPLTVTRPRISYYVVGRYKA